MRIILSLFFFLQIVLELVSGGHISPELKARLTRVESITSLFSELEFLNLEVQPFIKG